MKEEMPIVNYCVDCQHYESRWIDNPLTDDESRQDLCYKNQIIIPTNIITGEGEHIETAWSYCQNNRRDSTKCGKYGNWFEPKIIKPSLFQKIKNWLEKD